MTFADGVIVTELRGTFCSPDWFMGRVIPLEAAMIVLVDISQDAGANTTSAPVCLVSRLCWTDNWLQLESIDTDRASNEEIKPRLDYKRQLNADNTLVPRSRSKDLMVS